MAGPQNAIIGDDSFGTELPETIVEDQALANEVNMAKFSKTKEFQTLKEHLEGRMNFYTQYLPDGRAIVSMPEGVDLGQMWVVANTIIGEFKAVIQAYEMAATTIEERNAPRERT